MIAFIPKIQFLFLHLLLCLFLTACESYPSNELKAEWQTIAARDFDASLERPLIYQALVPNHWTRKDPLPDESIQDTTKSNCEFYIHEGGENIRITVHTFPLVDANTKIPPQAQVFRWKKQFEHVDPLTFRLSQESHGGFTGLFFESEGLIQGKPASVMGWSMQLATVYERLLSHDNAAASQLKRADYTIKVSGSPEIMQGHRDEIIAFANSFEFIDELPEPL